MSLLLLLGGTGHASSPDPAGTAAQGPLGDLRALLDAVFKSDDRIGGRGVTRLTTTLDTATVAGMFVESTIGFGENTEGTANAKILVGGEVIDAVGRTTRAPFCFTTLTRGVGNTVAKVHPPGTLVLDLSRNTSAIHRLRRAFLVQFALLEDLEVIARNLGLERCPGTSQEQLRRIIKAVAYLPKQTTDAFLQALTALTGGVIGTDFNIIERVVSDPWKVFVEIAVAIATDIKGRYLLNGGEPQVTTGLTEVVVDYPVVLSPLAGFPGAPSAALVSGRMKPNPGVPPPTNVPYFDYPAGAPGTLQFAVYDDTLLARRGFRDGLTNYATGGSALGNVITLGASPGPIGTPVLVDYTAFGAHYLAANEVVRQADDPNDNWAYLADPLLAARCLLDQIRAAGVKVELTTLL